MSEEKKIDMVNNPPHYALENGLECIDVMLQVFGIETVKAFCQGNAFKYVWRMNRKNGVEDAEKAVWYLNKYISLEGKADE